MGPYLTSPSGPLPSNLPQFPSPHKSLSLFGLVPYSLVSLRSILPLKPISECGFLLPTHGTRGCASPQAYFPGGVATRLGRVWGGPGVRGQARCLSAPLGASRALGAEASCAVQRRSVPVLSLAGLGVLGQGLPKAGGRPEHCALVGGGGRGFHQQKWCLRH